METKTALFADARCRTHLAGRDHPESPERFDAVMQALDRGGLLPRLELLEARSATPEDLLRCHTKEYLFTAWHDVDAGYRYLTTGDTEITPTSWEIALLAAGGVLNAVDAVASGNARNAFCAVRPPATMPRLAGEWDFAS